MGVGSLAGKIRGMNSPGNSIFLEKRNLPRRSGVGLFWDGPQPRAASGPLRLGEYNRRGLRNGPGDSHIEDDNR